MAKAYRHFPPADPMKRFMSHVELQSNGCWLWTAAKNAAGYAYFHISSRKLTYGHRFSYSHAKGEIPKGLVIDHLCRNTSCVNPEHLEAVTCGENTRRGMTGEAARRRWAAITHCSQGHEYTPENSYVYRSKKGYPFRSCRACERARTVRRTALKSATRAAVLAA